MNEIWKEISGSHGFYSVSNYVKIRSNRRLIIGKDGRKMNINERILKPFLDKLTGYYRVVICNSGTKKKYYVHGIIAKHFIINPKNKTQVNHINGIKTDNRIENLEWCSPSENMKHAVKIGLVKRPISYKNRRNWST